jgi:hypothetical protein
MTTLFFSYSHKDEALRNELETHLALLKRQGVISSWHDRRITAGRDIHETIGEQLDTADVVLLLVSAHFLASDYCYEREMREALQRHEEGRAVVIPVILHPCDWHSAPFGRLRATPTDGKPVSMFANQHEAFAIVAKDVRAAASALQKRDASATKLADTAATESERRVSVGDARSSNLRIKRSFDDHERDAFLEDTYEYIARFFDGSLSELQARNPGIKTRFKRIDAMSFTASIYQEGKRLSECSVWHGGERFGSNSIRYSNSADGNRSSFNESLSVAEDGYTLSLKPLGLQAFGRENGTLTQQGSAELYWSLLIRPLQE